MYAPLRRRIGQRISQGLGRAGAVLAAALLLAAGAALAQPAPAPFKLRVVGGLAGVKQYQQYEEPFWTQQLPRLSGGRYGADILPFDRAGVPGEDMLRLLQLGVLPLATVLLSHLTVQYPEYTAPDLAGLSPDMASARAAVAAFRPYLERNLRQQHGLQLLAIYAYPAQVVFCKKAFASLAGLAGRRVRVSSAGQADFVEALGAKPVQLPFAQIVAHVESGSIDCAITGTLSGHGLGLHQVTTHLHSMPLNWGLALFVANQGAWEALPLDLRQLLGRELPRLEAAIWAQADGDTAQGMACNTGRATCAPARPGAMRLVPTTPQDERLRQGIFAGTVLPRWLQRCGPRCDDVWRQTLGATRGAAAQ